MTVWDVAIWIRLHWFELAALALLLANLWFAFGILNVLRAMNQALLFLGSRSDHILDERTPAGPPPETGGGGIPTPTLLGTPHPLLINVALALLSWALVVVIIILVVAVRAML